MSVVSVHRTASFDDVAAEMDRRGRVIEALEREIIQLKGALKLSDIERRQWFIRFCLDKHGYFNRSDICDAFGVSVPQASLDIRKWLESNPGAATYNVRSKRYEPSASNNYARLPAPSGRARGVE